MTNTPLVDSFGRTHKDLRISVTDKCNYRCLYCMPKEGMQWLPREAVLTFEEIEQIARVFVDDFGVKSIRLTGGEPLVRAHLPVLVAKLAALGTELAITTNGSQLATAAQALADAGLHRVNVSLDSLQAERFATITGRDELDAVLAGIDAAQAVWASTPAAHSVKLNVVAMAGVNDDEILDFARFGRERSLDVRFIEFMPLDAQHEWLPSSVVSQEQIISIISSEFPLEPVQRGSAPAQRFRYADGAGEIGVIPSVSEPFCESCDRVRLTAEGALRNCLFSTEETDLRAIVRNPVTNSDDGAIQRNLKAAIVGEVQRKKAGHQIGQPTFIRPRKSMSQIGG